MKIAIEAQRIFRKHKHGMDMVALETIRNLQVLDKENEYFICVKPGEDSGVLDLKDNFHLIEVGGVSYPDWEQYYLPKALKKIKPDLVHFTSNTASFKHPGKRVITLHDIIYLEVQAEKSGKAYQRLGNVYRKWVVPPVVKKADAIITVSNFEKETIFNHFGAEVAPKLSVIYNGAAPHFFKAYSEDDFSPYRKQYGISGDFLFFLGNTDPKKNVRNVMKALKLLRQKGVLTMPLVMPDYGKEHLQKVLSEIEASDLMEDIILTGYIPNTDLPLFYQNCKLFLYPSLRESFGIPLVEALAGGANVLTANTSSMPEIGGDVVQYCDPKSAESIAEGIKSGLSKSSITKEAKQERASEFTWQETARKTLEVYKRVLG